MTDRGRTSLVVDVGPLRETYYTGIPNVVAEICLRLLREDWLDLYFDLDGRWVDNDSLRRCLVERSGRSLAGQSGRFPPADAFRAHLKKDGAIEKTVGLYTDHRPPRKLYSWEGKLVYDLSMVLAPECHPAESVRMYTGDFEQQIAASDVLFCISQSTAHDLAWIYGVERERLRVAWLGNGVDMAAARRIQTLIGKRPVEPFLLVLGSIEPRKNSALILEWLAEHPEVLEEVRIVFAGRQAWGDSFASLVDDKSLGRLVRAGRLVFLGYVDEKFRAALLVGASALIYPSLFEGFGLPLLEAMAIGTPVLSSVSTSMPEVLGNCGYYFDPYCVDSLHSAFQRFRSDRESGELEQQKIRARARAAGFSYDATYQVIIEGLFARQ